MARFNVLLHRMHAMNVLCVPSVLPCFAHGMLQLARMSPRFTYRGVSCFVYCAVFPPRLNTHPPTAGATGGVSHVTTTSRSASRRRLGDSSDHHHHQQKQRRQQQLQQQHHHHQEDEDENAFDYGISDASSGNSDVAGDETCVDLSGCDRDDDDDDDDDGEGGGDGGAGVTDLDAELSRALMSTPVDVPSYRPSQCER